MCDPEQDQNNDNPTEELPQYGSDDITYAEEAAIIEIHYEQQEQ